MNVFTDEGDTREPCLRYRHFWPCFFILISRVSPTATFWPLAVARFTSVLVLLIVVQIRQQQMHPSYNRELESSAT